jgi:hypothetical protein
MDWPRRTIIAGRYRHPKGVGRMATRGVGGATGVAVMGIVSIGGCSWGPAGEHETP